MIDDLVAWLAEQPVTRGWSNERRRRAAEAAWAAGVEAAARLRDLPMPPIERVAGRHVFAGVAKVAEWDARRGVIVLYAGGLAALAESLGEPIAAAEALAIAHERYHAMAPSHDTIAEEELASRVCAALACGLTRLERRHLHALPASHG